MLTIEAQNIESVFKAVLEFLGNGEAVKLKSPFGKVILMSEHEYNELTKAWKNAAYDAKLERSMTQARNGELIFKTLEELKALEQ